MTSIYIECTVQLTMTGIHEVDNVEYLLKKRKKKSSGTFFSRKNFVALCFDVE